MTKAQYIDWIRNRLGGDAHRKDIEYAIDQAYQQIISTQSIKNLDDFNFLTKMYTGVSVSTEAVTSFKYSTLPAPIIYLPEVNKGVRQINTSQGSDLRFYPMTFDEWEYTGDLISGGVHADMVGYITLSNKVYYHNIGSISTVRMVLAVPFSEFDSTDKITLPSGLNGDITQITLAILRGDPPRDTKNDYQ
jgi:hypothetical protein